MSAFGCAVSAETEMRLRAMPTSCYNPNSSYLYILPCNLSNKPLPVRYSHYEVNPFPDLTPMSLGAFWARYWHSSGALFTFKMYKVRMTLPVWYSHYYLNPFPDLTPMSMGAFSDLYWQSSSTLFTYKSCKMGTSQLSSATDHVITY